MYSLPMSKSTRQKQNHRWAQRIVYETWMENVPVTSISNWNLFYRFVIHINKATEKKEACLMFSSFCNFSSRFVNFWWKSIWQTSFNVFCSVSNCSCFVSFRFILSKTKTFLTWSTLLELVPQEIRWIDKMILHFVHHDCYANFNNFSSVLRYPHSTLFFPPLMAVLPLPAKTDKDKCWMLS